MNDFRIRKLGTVFLRPELSEEPELFLKSGPRVIDLQVVFGCCPACSFNGYDLEKQFRWFSDLFVVSWCE
jgi:hypothetical protein